MRITPPVLVFAARSGTAPLALTSARALALALAFALGASPVAAQIEVGPNDFRISFNQGSGDPDFDAFESAVAYNASADEYLVVWAALHAPGACGLGFSGEREIFAQRIDGATGQRLGSPIQVSDAGPACDGRFEPAEPAVGYSSEDDQYLIVWSGDDDVAGLVDDEFEIFGQRLTAAGAPIGADDFRISDMGGTGDTAFGAFDPDLAYDAAANQFLVVWSGDDDEGSLVDGEFEVFGQLISKIGSDGGANDFRISDMGPDGDDDFEARKPAVAFNALTSEYLVVWAADDDQGGMINGELEIFGQRLSALGVELGSNDMRLSEHGGSGSGLIDADLPAVAISSTTGHALVVWEGTGLGLSPAREIFAQLVDGGGDEIGSDFRLSDMGGTSASPTQFQARSPAAAYLAANDEYLVVWHGDDNVGELVAGESEIFAQRLDAAGGEVGRNDHRISDMGPNGNAGFNARLACIAADSPAGRALVGWQAGDDLGGMAAGEIEIFGQLLVHGIFVDGFESGDVFAWSDSVSGAGP